jgi:nucleotide-binding universal stress UspA family protein
MGTPTSHIHRTGNRADPGTVLICYDGSDLSQAAIAEAARELGPSRSALVLTVWEPFAVTGFGRVPVPVSGEADEELEREAERVAAEGTELARDVGFDAEPLVEEGAPVWHRIVEVARERGADLVVLGSHGRSGLRYLLLGSVATAVSQHAGRPVLIVSHAGTHGVGARDLDAAGARITA